MFDRRWEIRNRTSFYWVMLLISVSNIQYGSIETFWYMKTWYSSKISMNIFLSDILELKFPKLLTLFTKKFRLRCLTRLWTHLYTPKLMYYIKMKTGTSQSAERLQAPWGLFLAMFKATANELRQEKSQLRCYEDIVLTGYCHKIY